MSGPIGNHVMPVLLYLGRADTVQPGRLAGLLYDRARRVRQDTPGTVTMTTPAVTSPRATARTTTRIRYRKAQSQGLPSIASRASRTSSGLGSAAVMACGTPRSGGTNSKPMALPVDLL